MSGIYVGCHGVNDRERRYLAISGGIVRVTASGCTGVGIFVEGYSIAVSKERMGTDSGRMLWTHVIFSDQLA